MRTTNTKVGSRTVWVTVLVDVATIVGDVNVAMLVIVVDSFSHVSSSTEGKLHWTVRELTVFSIVLVSVDVVTDTRVTVVTVEVVDLTEVSVLVTVEVLVVCCV